MKLFDSETRAEWRRWLEARARADQRIVAAAAVGSSASGGDRWSDLDLSFAVADGVAVESVLADWTEAMANEAGAATLFDLTVDATIYRVFLLPDLLQVDLSFAPTGAFGPRGPRFALLFGEAATPPWIVSPPPARRLGIAIHHVVRAYLCLARGKVWQAEQWLHDARDLGLALACERFGLPADHGRGLDALPPSVRAAWEPAFVGRLEPESLRGALGVVVARLLDEAAHVPDIDPRARERLATLSALNDR